MAYATGRTRTLTFSGTFSGEMSYSWDGFVGGDGYNTNFLLSVDAYCVGAIPAIRDFGFTIASNEATYGTGHDLAGTIVSYSAQMGSFGDGSPGTSVSGTVYVDPWTIGHESGGAVESGTYEFTVEVTEYFEITPILDVVGTDYLDPTDTYPNWGDDSLPFYRGSPAMAVRYFEMVEEGAATSLTVTAPGIAISMSSTTLSAFEILRNHLVSASCEGYSSGVSLPAKSAYVTVPYGYYWDLDYFDDGVENHADTFLGVACNYSGVLGGGADGSNYVSVARVFHEPIEYLWDLRNFRYDQAMNQSLIWKIFDTDETTASTELTVTGSATRAITQIKEEIVGNVSGALTPPGAGGVDTVSVDTLSYCNARIKGESLVGIGEDEHNWRGWIHGKPYDAFQLEQSATYTLTGTSTSGWSAGANTTLAAGLQFTVSGGTGSGTRSWTSPGENVEGYRWVKVRCRSVGSDNVSFNLEANGKTWDLTTSTSGTWVERYVDLCCASDASWSSDNTSSRYPVTHDTQIPLSESASWGLTYVTSMAITGIPDGTVLEISNIDQVRRDHSKASFLCDIKPEFLHWTSPTDETYAWTGVYLDTDGRNNDIPDQFHVVPNEGLGDPYYVHYTIDQHVTTYVMSGYTATLEASWPDGYHTEDLNSFFVEGAGYYVTFSGSTATFNLRSDLSVANTQIHAQPLWDWVKVYPGAGDVWSGSDFDVPTPLATHWAGRGRTQGIVFGTDNSPSSGTNVVSSPDVGSGTTDSFGCYKTGIRFGKEEESVNWRPSASSVNVSSVNHHDVNEQRICWREAATTSGGLSYDVSPGQRHYLAYFSDEVFSGLTLGEILPLGLGS